MAQRYERQVSERGPAGAYLQNYVTPDSAGFGIAQAFGDMGGAMEKVALSIQVFNDKQDEIDLMAATNDYNRRMNTYLNDPDNGQLVTRKLGDARGVLMDTENFADEQARDIKTRLSDKAADRFDLLEGRVRQAYTNKSALYEAEQREAHGKAEAGSALEGFIQSVQSDPLNSEMLEVAIDGGALIIEQQMPGASQAAKTQALKKWASQAEAAGIQMLISDNPMLADQMIKNSKYLLPADAAALSEKVKPERERVETQAIVADLIGQFGYNDIPGVSKHVRENYSGALQDAIMNRYKVLSHEMTAGEGAARAEESRRQNEYWEENYYKRYIANGTPAPVDQIDRDYAAGNISYSHRDYMLRWNGGMSTRSTIEKMLKGNDPNWDAKTPLEREEAVMNSAQITPEMREEALSYLREAVANPESGITPNDIDEFYSAMRITAGEAANYKQILSQTTREQKGMVKTQSKMLDNDLNSILNDQSILDSSTRKAYANQAKSAFMESVIQAQEAGLKGDALHEFLKNARRHAIASAITDLNKEAFGFITDPNTFDASVRGLLERIGEETHISAAPEFRVDKITLSSHASTISTVPRNNSYTLSMVPQGKYVTDDFYAKRDGRIYHGAIDVAAPEGSPIYSGDFGASLSVTRTFVSGNGGNSIELSGKLEDGRSISVTFLHLKSLAGVNNGMIINPGDYIAAVGNSGTASTGAHMHIEVAINGKKVDPEKHLAEVAEMRNQQRIKNAETANKTIEPPKETAPPVVSGDITPPPVVSDDSQAIGNLMNEMDTGPGAATTPAPAPIPKLMTLEEMKEELKSELLGGLLGGDIEE